MKTVQLNMAYTLGPFQVFYLRYSFRGMPDTVPSVPQEKTRTGLKCVNHNVVWPRCIGLSGETLGERIYLYV